MPPEAVIQTSDDITPRLHLPYLAAGQAQKHVTVNDALSVLDGLVQTAVQSATVPAQPAAPADGALYILPAGRTGAEWALHPVGALLRHDAGDWTELAAGDGWLAYARDTGVLLLRTAGAWKPLGAALNLHQNLERLGVGTAADAANPLSAKLNKALFTARAAAEGGDGDLRLTFNKETAADVLSLLFQTGFSGRAELGLIGDDLLRLKLSADGSSWTEILTASADGSLRVGGTDNHVVLKREGGVEISSNDGTPPYVDFKNAGADDFDMRIQQQGADGLLVTGVGRQLLQLAFNVAAGETPLTLLAFDGAAFAMKRVKFGAAGTGPGGAGRALYVD